MRTRRTKRSRKVAALLVFAGAGMVAGPMAMAFAESGTASAVGFFDVSGDANGVQVSYGNPAPLAGGYVPHSTAQLGAGPSGHALTSLAWPGELAGNAGTLGGLVGIPLPPNVLANGNDPVKAEAQSSGGRDEQSLGPMRALVDGASSSASTAVADFSGAAAVGVGRVVSKARTYIASDGQPTAEAETDLQDVTIGGLIHIASVTAVAKGSTDGNKATLTRTMSLSGVSVQGQGATLDDKGLRVGAQNSPNPLDPVSAGANEALKAMGMRAYVTKPLSQTDNAGSGFVNTGAVVFTWSPDPANVFTVVLGGAAVTVKATPGSASDLTGLGSEASSLTGGASFGPSLDSGSSISGSPSLSSGPASGSPRRTGGGAVASPVGFTNASSISDRVPMGWMLIGLAGMVFIGLGLDGMRAATLDLAGAGTTCPLEKGAP